MKDKHIYKIIAKFAPPRAKAYAFKVQKDDHQIKGSDIKKT